VPTFLSARNSRAPSQSARCPWPRRKQEQLGVPLPGDLSGLFAGDGAPQVAERILTGIALRVIKRRFV
jgi:hypothetical protein